MIRVFFSIVFAFLILASSLAHAAMLPKDLAHVHTEMGHQGELTCELEVTTFVTDASIHCVMVGQPSSGSQRCLVDIAPAADRTPLFAVTSGTNLSILSFKAPHERPCKPAHRPPRQV